MGMLIVFIGTPFTIFVSACVIGGLLAGVEGWPYIDGVDYVVGNMAGVSPLVQSSPDTELGDGLDIIISLWSMMLVNMILGITAGMQLMSSITDSMPEQVCGLLRYLLIYVPAALIVITCALGGFLAAIEGWSFRNGFFYMISIVCGLGTNLTNVKTTSGAGKFVEILCSISNMTLSGALIGIVGSHPLFGKFVNWMEGSYDTGASEKDASEQKENVPEVTKVDDTEVMKLRSQNEQLTAEASTIHAELQRLREDNFVLSQQLQQFTDQFQGDGTVAI